MAVAWRVDETATERGHEEHLDRKHRARQRPGSLPQSPEENQGARNRCASRAAQGVRVRGREVVGSLVPLLHLATCRHGPMAPWSLQRMFSPFSGSRVTGMRRSMMIRMQGWAAATLLGIALISGCASDSTTGPDGNDAPPESPGHGSGTLLVMGVVDVDDTGVGEFVTDFSVMVEDVSGTGVSDAAVAIESGFGSRMLAKDQGTPGLYTTTRSGQPPAWYRLSVHAGADSLAGLTVWVPQPHSITQPSRNDIVDADTILNVRWTAPDKARECRLTTLDYDSSWINGDSQTLWVPAVGNPPRADQRICVLRRNTQFTEAGLPGSRLSVNVRCTVEPIIAQ